jgi:hypothetical protein
MRIKIGLVLVVIAIAAVVLAFKPLTSVRSVAITCADTATAIASADGFNSVMCGNTSATVVYFGGSTVSTANGFPVCSDVATCTTSTISIDTHQGELYCRVASGTQAIRCILGK